MERRALNKAFRNAWILWFLAAVFVVVFAYFAYQTNRDAPAETWRMGGVPFVPASSSYANEYYSPVEHPRAEQTEAVEKK